MDWLEFSKKLIKEAQSEEIRANRRELLTQIYLATIK